MVGGTENSQENTSTIDLYRLNVASFVAFVYTEAQEQIDARELDVLTAVHQRRLQSFRALHPSAGAATPQRCAESGQALRADLDRMAQIHHQRLDRLRPADPAQAQRRVRIDADLEQLEARRAATDREIIATRLAAEEARDSRRFDDLCADILHRLEDLPGTLRPGASIDSDDTLRAALADIDAALDRCLRLHQGRIDRLKDLDPHLRLGWLGPTAAACIADLTRDLATLRACRHLVTGGPPADPASTVPPNGDPSTAIERVAAALTGVTTRLVPSTAEPSFLLATPATDLFGADLFAEPSSDTPSTELFVDLLTPDFWSDTAAAEPDSLPLFVAGPDDALDPLNLSGASTLDVPTAHLDPPPLDLGLHQATFGDPSFDEVTLGDVALGDPAKRRISVDGSGGVARWLRRLPGPEAVNRTPPRTAPTGPIQDPADLRSQVNGPGGLGWHQSPGRGGGL